jgi:CTP synthase
LKLTTWLFIPSLPPKLNNRIIEWSNVNSQERLFDTVHIALVGKYTDLKDSYMSVTKALEHSAFRIHRKLKIHVRLSPELLRPLSSGLQYGR